MKPLKIKNGKWHKVAAFVDWRTLGFEVVDSIGGRVCYVRWRKQEEMLLCFDPRVK